MKGIVLAGGRGTRLQPLTHILSKQLHLVYKWPMIYYPIRTLVRAGIREILVIVSPDHPGLFMDLLDRESETGGIFGGIEFSFKIQRKPRGLADAFIEGANHIGDDSVAMILGDNIFVGVDFNEAIRSFSGGARIFAKQVSDPERFGVVWFDDNGKATDIIEKPENPDSNWAVVGLYLYDNSVVHYARELTPSKRGEIEITDLNLCYLKKSKLDVVTFASEWADAGNHDALLDIQIAVRNHLNSGGTL